LLLNISRVNNLRLDTTEYEGLESKLKLLLVFPFSGFFLIIATGSEINKKYSSDIVFDSLSFVINLMLYSHSFGSTTFIIHGFHIHSFTNENHSFDDITRLCDKICLHHIGIVADQSKTIHFCHSCVPNFSFSKFFNFLLFAYTLMIADFGCTSIDSVSCQSNIPSLILLELFTVKCTK